MPDITAVRDAASRLAGRMRETPLLEAPLANQRLGGRLLLKPECLQVTGSFKARGAYNRISRLPETARARGVVACSSGNHAQGVAWAASVLGAPATIVMPADAPTIKIANTRAYGAKIVLYDRDREDRDAIAAAVAAECNATLVPPYDHPDIVAGQGTVGLELAAQTRALDTWPETVVTPCGGGGLSSGLALALAAELPDCRLVVAEPAGFEDTGRSLAAGRRVANEPGAGSICDALLSPMPGAITFDILSRHDVTGVAVPDEETIIAMRFAFEHFKLVLEPGGAVALAAVLAGRVEIKQRVVAVVASGGNVDADRFAAALAAA